MRKIYYLFAQLAIFSAITLLLSLLLIGCGSRKVQKSQIKEETKTEISDNTKIETKTETKTDVIVINENDELTIEPIDTIKPMTINGKQYKNARIRHKKSSVKAIDKTIVNVAKNENKDVTIIQKTKKEASAKNVERKAGYWWLLWFLLIIPIWFVYRYFNFSSFI